MRSILCLIPAIVVLMSCKEAPETRFAREGISFTCPRGWEITEQESIDSQGYYLSIEKEGLSSSGLITLSWVNGSVDLNEWIDVYEDQLSDNIVYKNASLKFGQPYEDKFNNINSVAVKFTASLLGLKHEGSIHVFYGNDKTIAVLKQEAIEDKAKNKNGFEVVEESFKME